jgi:hypothetical protein
MSDQTDPNQAEPAMPSEAQTPGGRHAADEPVMPGEVGRPAGPMDPNNPSTPRPPSPMPN